MERDWARLGAAIAAARKAKGLKQPDLGGRVGVSRGTIQAIERGQGFAKVTPTLRAIERQLGWAEGSVEAVLDGGDAKPVETASPVQVIRPEVVAPEVRVGLPDMTEGLPLRVVEKLAGEGPVLDAQVLDLTLPGSGTHMIVVVKGEPGVTQEQVREGLLAWANAERLLRGLPNDPDDSSDGQDV